MKYDIIVVGSGPGGYVAAIRAAQLGRRVALVERAEAGGVCLNWGCIPTKALLKSAQVYAWCKAADHYGLTLDGEVRPALERIVDRSRGVAETMSKGVAVLLRKARPREMPFMPIDGEHVLSSRHALELRRLPASMVVVGSGAIGSEFAWFYATLGVKVTLVEYLPRIMPLEDEEVSKTMERVFRKLRATVLTSTTVRSVVVGADGRCVVEVEGRKGVESLSAAVVLSAVGIKSNIEGIGLEELGIAVERDKVVVDPFYRTNVPGIYAIGDIVGGPALAHVASAEAVCCIEAICGLNPAPVDYSTIPSCIFTSPEVASVGMTEQQARERGIDVRVGRFPFTASGKATAAGDRDGFVKLLFDGEERLIGAHMVGAGVTEMLAEPTLAKALGVTAHRLARIIHAHPTMNEGVMEAAEAAMGAAIHL